jgi:sulfite reductase beta subunit-like hemoprotein
MRVYNQFGRRDNKYKARIKILVKAVGAEEFARQVEAGIRRPQGRPGNPDPRRAGPRRRLLQSAALRALEASIRARP